MIESEEIIKSIRSVSDKDSMAYKVTDYYYDLTSGIFDDEEIAIVSNKLLDIEKYLIEWSKSHHYNYTIMQPEENALRLINDLREKGLIREK